jgi:hypothetical protein
MRYICMSCHKKFRFAATRTWHIFTTFHVRYEKEELNLQKWIMNDLILEQPMQKRGLDRFIEKDVDLI